MYNSATVSDYTGAMAGPVGATAHVPPTGLEIVDTTAFNSVKSLDEGSSTQEFSKALFWSWADQSEIAIETIETALTPDKEGKIAWQKYLDKTKEFKFASSALGVVQVSKTLANMVRVVHPAEKKERAYSYRASYDEEDLTQDAVAERLLESQDKAIERAEALLKTLKEQVREAIEWFEDNYKPKFGYS